MRKLLVCKLKMCFSCKVIVFCFSLIAILTVFCSCTLSKKMQADMGLVNNKDTYYYGSLDFQTNSLVCKSENGDIYQYSFDTSVFSPDNIDEEKLERCEQEPEGFYFDFINSNFAVAVYKLDRMHKNRLHKHLTDELIYLNNESKKAEVLYQSGAHEKIIYGTVEYVILYNADFGVYRYISLKDNSIIREIKSNIDPFAGDYDFNVYEEKQILKVNKYNSVKNEITLVDSISLAIE